MNDNRLHYREVIPYQFTPRRWKELSMNVGSAQSTLQDIKLPDCAGGFSFQESNTPGSVVRNRFIYWKSYNDIFELVEHSLDYNLSGNYVRLRFQGAPVLDSVSIHEMNNEIVVLVSTVCSIHRLTFTHPTKLQQYENFHKQSSDSTWPSIFSEISVAMIRDSANFHEYNAGGLGNGVPHSAASILSRDGDAIFAIASGLGAVLLINFSRQGEVVMQELRQTSVIHQLFSGIMPLITRNMHEVATTSSLCLHSVDDEIFAFTLCQDHKLRMWSCSDYECRMAVDLIELIGENPSTASGKQLGSQSHSLCKAQRSDSSTIYLGAFLCFANQKQICIVQPVYTANQYQLMLIATVHCPDFHLVNFCLTMDCIWSLWVNLNSEPVLKYMPLDAESIQSLGWTEATLENFWDKEFQMSDSFMDPQDAYLQQIFQPGHFSTQTISKAIGIYRRPTDNTFCSEMNVPVHVLKEEVITVIENEVQNQAGDCDLSDEECWQLRLDGWSKFYSCCVQYQVLETKMMGLMVDDQTGMVCLIKKSGFSLLRPLDAVESLMSMKSADSVFNNSLLTITDDAALWPDILVLAQCFNHIECQLTEDLKQAFIQDLFHQESPEKVAGAVVNRLLLLNGDQSPSSSLLKQIINIVNSILHLIPCLEILMGQLDLASGEAEDMDSEKHSLLQASEQLKCNRLFASFVGASVIAQSVSQIIKARLDLCRDVLLLLLILLHSGECAGVNPQVSQQIENDLLPKIITLTQAYHVIYWISQNVATEIPGNSLESGLCQLAVMNITESNQSSVTVSKFQKLFSQPVTLIEAFVHLDGGLHSRSLLAQKSFLGNEISSSWADALNPLANSIVQLLWPINASFLFPEFLLLHCQYLQLIEYARLLYNCSFNSSSRQFLVGYSHLNLGEPEKAVDWFLQAADGAQREEFLHSKILEMASNNDKELLQSAYFVKIARLMEQFGYPDQVITIAKAAIDNSGKNNPNMSTFWSLIFKHHLELGHIEDAYSALNSVPEHAHKVCCLRKFVVTLCEHRKYKALIEFPYLELQEELVPILESRARSIDLTFNDYYNILYSFHVFRGNYRTAGSIMYEYGMRLGHEVPGLKGLQKQAKCYLTALNCLRLVNPQYAWIVKPVPMPQHDLSPPNMSPKRSSDGEEKLPPHASKQKIEVLDLDEIKKEYDLLHAHLKLCKKEQNGTIVIGPLNPGETLGLLINSGLYDTALHIASIFHLHLEPIFAGLASRCVKLTELNTGENTETLASAWDWLLENELGQFRAAEGRTSEHAWGLLQSYLENYESKGQTRYHRCVLEKLLSMGSAVPHWLLASYKVRNIAELIGLYTEYDQLAEAATVAMEFLDAVLGQGAEYFGLKNALHANASPVWVPYTKLDILLAALKENSDDDVFRDCYQKLKAKLHNYKSTLSSVCKDMIVLKQ